MSRHTEPSLVTVIESGDSLALIISRESAASLGVSSGDLLQAAATPGGLLLTHCDASVTRQLQIAKQVMEERRDVLRRLAE
jgi:putative addiction module antidote